MALLAGAGTRLGGGSATGTIFADRPCNARIPLQIPATGCQMARPLRSRQGTQQGLPRRVQSGQRPLRQTGKNAASGWPGTTGGCGAARGPAGRSAAIGSGLGGRTGRSVGAAMPSLTRSRMYWLSDRPSRTAAAHQTAFSSDVMRRSIRTVPGMAVPRTIVRTTSAGPTTRMMPPRGHPGPQGGAPTRQTCPRGPCAGRGRGGRAYPPRPPASRSHRLPRKPLEDSRARRSIVR